MKRKPSRYCAFVSLKLGEELMGQALGRRPAEKRGHSSCGFVVDSIRNFLLALD
jgi:hypothetical protein